MGKQLGVWLLVIAMCLAAMNPQTVDAAAKLRIRSVTVTNVKGKKLSLVKGDTFQLKVKVSAAPNKKKYKKVDFLSWGPFYCRKYVLKYIWLLFICPVWHRVQMRNWNREGMR